MTTIYRESIVTVKRLIKVFNENILFQKGIKYKVV